MMKEKILILFISTFPLISWASENFQRQVSVSGECNHLVTPDRGAIVVTVEYQNIDLGKATKDATVGYQKVLEAVKKLDLKNANLQTSEYSVNQVVEWENNKQINKGFKARMGLRVATSEIDKIGDVIAIASKEKAKDVGALETYMSDEKQLQEEMTCLEDASKNARAKAEKLARSLGAKLGNVLTVNESGRTMPYWPRPMMMKASRMMMQTASEQASPDVEAGQQNLTINIQVSFSIQ